MDYIFIIYIIFGLLPSLVWLSFYLKEDLHPEPKRMILKIFLWGALITIPVFFIQIGLAYLLDLANIDPIITSIIYWFLIIAFSEEMFKYLVIRAKVFNSPNLDEPVDLMIYMVVAALGFAAIENILYLFSPVGQMPFDQTVAKALVVTLVRFIGATFLHTLCSALVGYSVAISFSSVKRKYIPFTIGMLIAILLHGVYNLSLMTIEGPSQFIIPAITIIILSILVLLGFSRLKKLKGTSKID